MTEADLNDPAGRFSNEQLCGIIQQNNALKAAAQTRLIHQNLACIRKHIKDLAAVYPQDGVNRDDLVQDGAIGILEAAERFDPGKDIQFLTYADSWINKEIRKSLRFLTWNACMAELPQESTGTEDDFADNDDCWNALLSGMGRSLASEFHGTPETAYIRKETMETLYRHMETLTEREKTYVWFRYGFADCYHTRQEIAECYHLPMKLVRNIETKLLRKLNDRYEMEYLLWDHQYQFLTTFSNEDMEILLNNIRFYWKWYRCNR